MEHCELSVVIPCLDEADTIGKCVAIAIQAMKQTGVQGEVIVADNGSRDGSQQIAIESGASIVEVPERGYGAALMSGIESSRGKFVVIGDADDSYDFSELPKFLVALRSNFELVQGCRLPRGGGRIMPNAMPILHRWIGNPFLSWLVRVMFHVPINDVYCGMRGFSRQLYDRLDLRCTGMEFATEMIIKAGRINASMAEVPITLHPDGRRAHGPHLRTLRDGWRTLRLFLVYSPRWTFFYPGVILMLMAAIGYSLALPQVRIFGAALDVHTLMVASLAGLLGWQCILLATLARIFAGREGLMSFHPKLERFTVEHGLLLGFIAMVLGGSLIAVVAIQWWQIRFGSLDYPQTMRWVVPGVTLFAIGFQTLMASMLASVLRMNRRTPNRRTPNRRTPNLRSRT